MLPGVEIWPTGHGVQAEADDAATIALDVPAGQAKHALIEVAEFVEE